MGKRVEKNFQKKKKSLRPNAASYNNASWYTDTDRFLEYSLSRGSLYYKGTTLEKIILFWGGTPCIVGIILRYIQIPNHYIVHMKLI